MKNQKMFLEALSTMPLLRHGFKPRPFNIDESEVVKWIMAYPDFKQWLFQKAANSGRIKYFEAEGGWRGVPRGAVGRKKKRAKDGIVTVDDGSQHVGLTNPAEADANHPADDYLNAPLPPEVEAEFAEARAAEEAEKKAKITPPLTPAEEAFRDELAARDADAASKKTIDPETLIID